MDSLEKENARRSVLERLGISSFVTTAALDISAGHSLHVEQQRTPARFIIDGLTIDAPAGVYHPTPESSSLLFIRNIMAMNKPKIPKTLEIGAGCGAISLFVAHRWKSTVVATDIAPEALEAIRKNARLNDIAIEPVHSDLFDRVEDRDGGRGGRIIFEQYAQVGYGRFVSAGEYGGRFCRLHRVLKSQAYGRAGSAGGAAANRVYDHHDRASGG